jgi:hypothetical protein
MAASDNFPGGVTHLCPRGPAATGLGPDWSEERDVARAGMERVEGGHTTNRSERAADVSLGANGTLISATRVIGITVDLTLCSLIDQAAYSVAA